MPRHLALLLLLLLAFASCKPQIAGHWTSATDTNINGAIKSTRTRDGITRTLESTAALTIKDGTVTKFPKGTLIKLQENGGPKPREAELRETEDHLELWIKDQPGFRRGSPEDDAWLTNFLREFTTKEL